MSKKSKEGKRTYVIDTNVPLHDPQFLNKFEEHDLVIPIVVLEELDRFKKGSETLNLNAREFARKLDELSSQKIFNGGVSLGKNKGTLKISVFSEDYPEEFKKAFMEDTEDHRIIATAFNLQKKSETGTVVLVSKDINVRSKARALGILAEDYRNDTIKNVAILQTQVIPITDEKELGKMKDLEENQIISIGEKYYRWNNGIQKEINRWQSASNIKARNVEQSFALDALLDPGVSLVALTGIAGSGKTLLAIAAALEQSDVYDSILVARPIIELSNKTLGFLPGGVDEKVDPYMMPLYDNLGVIRKYENFLKSGKKKKSDQNSLGKEQTLQDWMKEKKIEILALNYVRGRTLSQTFFIIDEAQNLTPHEIKTIVTRAGEATKIVFTGDVSQIDSPYLDEKSSGLSYLIDRFSGQSEFVHVNLLEGERSPLAEKASKLL